MTGSASFPSLPGKTLSHYQILEEVGKGTTGTVYHAFDTRLKRRVALKVLRPGLAADQDIIRRFLHEAQYPSLLNHPNIAAIYAIEQDQGRMFIVMEYVIGKTLDKITPPDGLAPELYLHYAVQMAEALSAAHEAGIIHRDLKPSNVIVAENHHLRVVDFGLAKANTLAALSESGDKTLDGTILGTVGYMSPEQKRGEPCDPRSDIFSLGAILYEMITGKRALAATFTADISASPDLPQKVPKDVAAIVRRCMEPDATSRYQSAGDLLVDLRAATSALSIPRSQEIRSTVRRHERPRKRVRVVIASSILGLGLLPIVWRLDPGLALASVRNSRKPEAGVLPAPNNVSSISVTDRYYRALTHQEKSDALCIARKSGACDVDATITELEDQISDLDAVLRLRPRHAASLWSRGLAHSGLCELQSQKLDWDHALQSCNRALADFDEVLKPPTSYPDLPISVPEESSVLWQRGLTHTLRAHIAGWPLQSYMSDLAQARKDFGDLLHGGARYAAFLEKRRPDLVRHYDSVSAERQKVLAAGATI